MSYKRISVILLSLAFLANVVIRASANPIPIGTVIIHGEEITALIYLTPEGTVRAMVNGIYKFSTIPPMPENVTMYYPIPPNATNISVEKDGVPVDWTWNNTLYHICVDRWFSTDFPIIKWTINPTETFNITTHYEHPVPTPYGGNTYAFLYAYGSYDVLGYAKYCPANITVWISTLVAHSEEDIKVYLLPRPCGMERIFPEIRNIAGWWRVYYTEGNATGTKDFLVTIEKHVIGVGGSVIPIDKLGLLAPYIGLASLTIIATVVTIFCIKRIKHKKQKQ